MEPQGTVKDRQIIQTINLNEQGSTLTLLVRNVVPPNVQNLGENLGFFTLTKVTRFANNSYVGQMSVK